MPNNGTLRLPLKPVGLHSDPIEVPADPDLKETTTVSPTTTTTRLPTGTTPAESTKLAVVDPVIVTTSETTTTMQMTSSTADPAPSKSLGIDPPSQDKPSDGGDEKGDNDDKEGIDKTVHHFWDWFTGKVDEWWGKVTGNSASGDGDGDSDPGDGQ